MFHSSLMLTCLGCSGLWLFLVCGLGWVSVVGLVSYCFRTVWVYC